MDKKITISDVIDARGIFSDGDWVESKDQDPSGDVRLIQLADIGDGTFIDKSNRFLTEEKAKQLKCTFLNKGDILVARMPDPIGRACVFPGVGQKAVTVVDVCVIRPNNSEVYQPFLKYLINSEGFRNDIKRHVTGTTRKRISRGNLNKIKFHLPGFADQKRIAKVLSDCEALIQKRKNGIDLLDELLKSTFLEMFGDPVKNEKGWDEEQLHVVTHKIGSGATPKGGKNSYKDSGISLIRSLNIHDNEFKRKDLVFIDDLQASKLSIVEVEANDVLFNITGASVCRVAIVPNEVLPARVNQHVSILRCINERILPNYLLHYLISQNVKKSLLKIAQKGGATREAITKEDLEKLLVLIPPIESQKSFSEIVEKIKTVKIKLKLSLFELDRLYGNLSQKAFKGELDLSKVPIPTDLDGVNHLDLIETPVKGSFEHPEKDTEPPEFEHVEKPDLDAFKSRVLEILLDADIRVEIDTPLIGDPFSESARQKAFIQQLRALKEPFTFEEFWEKLNTEYSIDFDYEDVKGVVFDWLKGDTSWLKQHFDESQRKIVFTAPNLSPYLE